MTELQDLKDLYTQFKKTVSIPNNLLDRLSPPLLLHPTTRWKEAEVRVLIVGQETLEWGFDAGSYYDWPYASIWSFEDFLTSPDSIEAMIHGYKVFEYSRYHPKNHRSPFWRAYRQIRRNFDNDIDGLDTSVLWTNIYRMSLDGGSVVGNGTAEEIKCIQQTTQGLLRAEIKILKPDIVLFFTGPRYNDIFYSEFNNLKLYDFNGLDMSRTAWIAHPSLPAISLRTYHPGYLNRGHWDLIDSIERAIVERST